MQSVVDLGLSNVLLIDKTGTLTRNELMVVQLYSDEKKYVVTGSGYFQEGSVYVDGQKIMPDKNQFGLWQIGLAGYLLNTTDIVYQPKRRTFYVKGDPIEASLYIAAQKIGITKDIADQFHKLYEIPFTLFIKYMQVFLNIKVKELHLLCQLLNYF